MSPCTDVPRLVCSFSDRFGERKTVLVYFDARRQTLQLCLRYLTLLLVFMSYEQFSPVCLMHDSVIRSELQICRQAHIFFWVRL